MKEEKVLTKQGSIEELRKVAAMNDASFEVKDITKDELKSVKESDKAEAARLSALQGKYNGDVKKFYQKIENIVALVSKQIEIDAAIADDWKNLLKLEETPTGLAMGDIKEYLDKCARIKDGKLVYVYRKSVDTKVQKLTKDGTPKFNQVSTGKDKDGNETFKNVPVFEKATVEEPMTKFDEKSLFKLVRSGKYFAGVADSYGKFYEIKYNVVESKESAPKSSKKSGKKSGK